MQARSVDAIRAIAAEHPDDTVVVVTHADVVRMVLADLAGLHLDLFQRLSVEPASISAVALADGQARILKVSDTGDLTTLAPPPVRRPRARKGAR